MELDEEEREGMAGIIVALIVTDGPAMDMAELCALVRTVMARLSASTAIELYATLLEARDEQCARRRPTVIN